MADRRKMLTGWKSYRFYWILIAAVAAYTVAIGFMPWAGYDESEGAVKLSSYLVIGLVIFGILFFMVYLHSHLRRTEPTQVKGEQVLPNKLRYLAKPVGPGRKLPEESRLPKRDRWDDRSCKEHYVKELCTTCIHHRRRYYGNYCKHFGMVVDRPTRAAA
jgi:hypothetical protein